MKEYLKKLKNTFYQTEDSIAKFEKIKKVVKINAPHFQ